MTVTPITDLGMVDAHLHLYVKILFFFTYSSKSTAQKFEEVQVYHAGIWKGGGVNLTPMGPKLVRTPIVCWRIFLFS
jgi:hypothetical protein